MIVKKFSLSERSFSAVNSAQEYAKSLGYSYGSMCMDEPIALAKGDVSIAKWRNISSEEYPLIDGLLVSEDFRDGDVYVIIFEEGEVARNIDWIPYITELGLL